MDKQLRKALIALFTAFLKAIQAFLKTFSGGDEEDEDEEEAPKSAKKSKRPADDDDDEEDEDEPAPKKKPPTKGKKPVDDDDDEEDDSDNEDEDDEPPAKKKSKKPVDEDEDDEEEESDDDDIDSLPRSRLLPIAKKLGIDVDGMQVGALRKAITAARQKGNSKSNPKSAPAKGKKKPAADDDDDEGDGGDSAFADALEGKPKGHRLKVLQDCLSGVIEKHWNDGIEEAIAELGCGGDCYACPCPDEKTPEKQVKACIKSVQGALGLDLPEEVLAQL